MDIHTLQARFSTQEEAESAVRKLSSLKGDRFRVEREGSYAQAGTSAGGGALDAMTAAVPAGAPVENYSGFMGSDYAAGEELETDVPGGPASSFTLSANVPADVSDQARRVIVDAGGRMI